MQSSSFFTSEQNSMLEYLDTRFKPLELINLTYSDLKDLAKKFHCDYEKFEEVFIYKLSKNIEKPRNCNEIISDYMESLHLVSTGILELDKLLNGGFYSSQLFEVIGASGAGKTEFCYNILSNGVKNTKDKFLYLDSNQSFDYQRFLKTVGLEENSKNMSSILKKILHKHFLKKKQLYYYLLSLIQDLERMSSPLQNPLRYIIIENFSMIFFPVTDFMEYDQWISEFIKLFKILNNKFYIGILVTVMAKGEKKEFFGYRKKRILPSPWHFYPNVTVFIEKIKTLNTEKGLISIQTKYSLLQNEYNDPLRTVKINEIIQFK